MKRRHRKDENQDAIVAALEKLPGVSVAIISRPVDLIVGYKGSNYLIDIKNPEGSHGLTPAQNKFFNRWTGQVNTAETLQDIINILNAK